MNRKLFTGDNMYIVYILLSLFTVIVLGYGVKTMCRAERLDEYQEELDKYSVYLDERAHKLDAEEQQVERLFQELKDELNKRKNGQRTVQTSGKDV